MRKSDAAVVAPAAFLALWLFSLSAANDAQLGHGYCHVWNVDTKTLISSAIFSHPRYPDQEGLHNWILEKDVFKDFARRMSQPPDSGVCGAYEGLETAVESIEWLTKFVRLRKYSVFYTDWVPPSSQLVHALGPVTPPSAINRPSGSPESRTEGFGPLAREAIQAWQVHSGISDTGNFTNTLALMIQTALVLQNFDPGPADGLFGKKTLAATVAWQAAMGYAQTGDLDVVLAAILRTAMLLQDFDPGPLDAMFDSLAKDAIQMWQANHAQALAAVTSTQDLARTPAPEELGPNQRADAGQAERHSAATGSEFALPPGVQAAHDCLKVSWREGTPLCPGRHDKQDCGWKFDAHNTCGYSAILHYMVKTPSEAPASWSHLVLRPGDNWGAPGDLGYREYGLITLPRGSVMPQVSYCVNWWGAYAIDGASAPRQYERVREWYQNSPKWGSGAINTACLADK